MRLLIALQGESLNRLDSPMGRRWVASFVEQALPTVLKQPAGTLVAIDIDDKQLSDAIAKGAPPSLLVQP